MLFRSNNILLINYTVSMIEIATPDEPEEAVDYLQMVQTEAVAAMNVRLELSHDRD